MSKMFMNVKEVMEVLEVSESYAYKLMKRLNRELQAMGCQTIAGKVDRKYFYEQFYGTRSKKTEQHLYSWDMVHLILQR